MQRGTVQSS